MILNYLCQALLLIKVESIWMILVKTSEICPKFFIEQIYAILIFMYLKGVKNNFYRLKLLI
jgi:hypothetical protein